MGSEPKEYKTKFIEAGIMSYEDVGQGSVLLTREALDKMKKSFIGKPVFNLTHKDYSAIEAFDFKNLSDDEKDKMADGIITDIWTGDDGWDHAKMLIWDEETQNTIDKDGFSVSCAYRPTDSDGGGSYHGYNYDEEVIEGEYTHMAIVDSPRYERAEIYNSKGGNMAGRIFKFFFNEKEEEKKEDPKEEKKNMEDAYMENEEGEKIPVSELVKAYEEKQSSNSDSQKMNMEDEIELENGEKVSMKELYDSYKSKQNAESPLDENAEEVVDETKQNSNFKKVKENATKAPQKIAVTYTTEAKRIELGSERYGSVVSGGAK